MADDFFGPASDGAVSTRPTLTPQIPLVGSPPSWFAPCSSEDDEDGTQISAEWLNRLVGNLEAVRLAGGIDSGDVTPGDDDVLLAAILALITQNAPDLSGYVTTAALVVALSGFISADTIRGSSAGGATASFSFSALGLVSGVLTSADKSVSFNGAATGAGGMDAGAMPASGDLSIYAIYNPTTATWSSLGCTYATSHGETYTGSAMPAGYTVSRLISVHRTTSGSQFTPFVQVGRRINIGRILINGALASSTWTSVGTVPTPALAATARLEAQQTTTSSPSNIWFAPTSPGATSTLTHPGVVTSWSSNVQNDTTTVDVSIVAPGTLYHFVSQGQTWSAWLAGYTF